MSNALCPPIAAQYTKWNSGPNVISGQSAIFFCIQICVCCRTLQGRTAVAPLAETRIMCKILITSYSKFEYKWYRQINIYSTISRPCGGTIPQVIAVTSPATFSYLCAAGNGFVCLLCAARNVISSCYSEIFSLQNTNIGCNFINLFFL